jgi:hypothetical protein
MQFNYQVGVCKVLKIHVVTLKTRKLIDFFKLYISRHHTETPIFDNAFDHSPPLGVTHRLLENSLNR